MKIVYKDLLTGKLRWTNPCSYEVREVQWLGQRVKAVLAYRKTDCLVIPEWAVAPQSRGLLTQCTTDKEEGKST